MSLLTNIISYWKLDESSGNATDSAGSNTATNNNTVTYVTGVINNGANFVSASSQYFSVADNASLSPTGAMSISAWINLASSTTHAVIGKWDDSANDAAYLFRVDSGGNQLIFNIKDSGGVGKQASVSWTPSLSTWYHVAVVFDAAGNTLFYVNGAQQGATQTGMGTTIQDSTLAFQIGRQASNSSTYYNGKIDEIGMWSRALDSTDVSNLYNGGAGVQYPFGLSLGGNNLALLGVS